MKVVEPTQGLAVVALCVPPEPGVQFNNCDIVGVHPQVTTVGQLLFEHLVVLAFGIGQTKLSQIDPTAIQLDKSLAAGFVVPESRGAMWLLRGHAYGLPIHALGYGRIATKAGIHNTVDSA